jgi:hypothetical protein
VKSGRRNDAVAACSFWLLLDDPPRVGRRLPLDPSFNENDDDGDEEASQSGPVK